MNNPGYDQTFAANQSAIMFGGLRKQHPFRGV